MGEKERRFALRALLQGDGVTPYQFDAAMAGIKRIDVMLRFRRGFVYLIDYETDDRSIQALRRALSEDTDG